jgi:hypothetical protein
LNISFKEEFHGNKRGPICIRYAAVDDAKILCEWWNDDVIMNYAGFPGGWNISEEEIINLRR